jgi:hypothetical protein
MGSRPEATPGPVLVVSRHGAYALELRRAGLVVLEAAGLDLAVLAEPLGAFIIDAVASNSPPPAGWEDLATLLAKDDAPPVVAVVSKQPPAWLEQLERAVLVSAPISGRELAARVTAAAGQRPTPAPPTIPDNGAADLDLIPAQVVDLTDEMDRDTALAVRRSVAVGQRADPSETPRHGLSMPLRMARLGEVVDRLVDCLHGVSTLRDVCEDLAGTVDEQLGADVAVLVSRKPDAPWSVLAGVGLRPLEWRPVPRDPQVLSLLDVKRPILRVEASDDVRQSAGDLPCVSRNHLLIARHPTVDLLVVAGREHGSFTRDDVHTLGQLLEGMDGLADALMLCALAERLLPYLDT